MRLFYVFFAWYWAFIHPVYFVLKQTLINYQRDKVSHLGAALAYYTIFSLPAILIIIIGIVGFLFGEAAVRGEVYESLEQILGDSAAQQVEDAVRSIGTAEDNWWATVIGISFLVFVATGVFYALQETLNTIFNVEEVEIEIGIKGLLINRLLSFLMILSIGAVLVASIISSTLLLELSSFIQQNHDWIIKNLPQQLFFLKPYIDYFTSYILVFLNMAIGILLITLFFTFLYKILPAVRLSWKYVFYGSLFSAFLFWIGELLMGIYISSTSVISAYGAAGSVIVLLIWVYYSSQLIFLGAEFIKSLYVYKGLSFQPKPFARALAPKRLEA